MITGGRYFVFYIFCHSSLCLSILVKQHRLYLKACPEKETFSALDKTIIVYAWEWDVCVCCFKDWDVGQNIGPCYGEGDKKTDLVRVKGVR